MILVISAVIAVLAISATIAVASAGSDDQLSGPDADRAIAAALEATGGGTANAVERDGEGGATFEVEVTRTDGTTVDVRLDAAFEVLSIEGEGTKETDGGADDADETGEVQEGNDTGDGGDVAEPNDADDGTERDDTDDPQEPDDPDGED